MSYPSAPLFNKTQSNGSYSLSLFPLLHSFLKPPHAAFHLHHCTKQLLPRSRMSPRLPSHVSSIYTLYHFPLLDTLFSHAHGMEFPLIILLHLGSLSCLLICRFLLTYLTWKLWRVPKSSPHTCSIHHNSPGDLSSAIQKNVLYVFLWKKNFKIMKWKKNIKMEVGCVAGAWSG